MGIHDFQVDSMQISRQSFLESHVDNSQKPFVKVEKRWLLQVVTPYSFVLEIQATTNINTITNGANDFKHVHILKKVLTFTGSDWRLS